MRELRKTYAIIIVTHNMQQAARVSDLTAFFTMAEDRAGYLVELGPTNQVFTNPTEQLTEDYISGRFGRTGACNGRPDQSAADGGRGGTRPAALFAAARGARSRGAAHPRLGPAHGCA